MPTVQFSMEPLTGVLERANIFHPMDYGAVGDNVVNDAAAVQACINASAGVGVVYLDRMYLCASMITVPSNTTIVGSGWASGLRFNYILASVGEVYVKNVDTTNGNFNIMFRDWKLQGAHAGGPLGDPSPTRCGGILFRRGSNVLVAHVEITNVPGISLAHQGISRFRAIANYVHDGGRDGITGGPFGSSDSVDNVIANNTIVDVHDDFIACNDSVDTATPGTNPPARWIIANNVCRGGSSLSADNFARGVLVSGATDVNVVGNIISDTWQQGVYIQLNTETGRSATRINVTNNVIRRIGQVGVDNTRGTAVQVQGGIDINVSHNRIWEIARYGLHFGAGAGLGVDGFEIVGNSIRKVGWRGSFAASQFWGMWIAGTSTGNMNTLHGVISDNRVLECTEVGIGLQWATVIDVFDNIVYNNNQRQTTGSFAAGMTARGCGTLRIHGNTSTDTQGVKTQGYGLSTQSEATTYLSIKDNYFQGNLTDQWIFNAAPTTLHLRSEEKTQAVAWGAGTQTPDYRLGETIIATLSGNITVADVPALARLKGARLNFVFIQDGTGGRTVAWNAAYKVTWSNAGNTAGLRSAITFEYDGTNWCQLAPQSAYV